MTNRGMRIATLGLAACATLAAAPAVADAEAVPYGYYDGSSSPPKRRDPWTSARFEGTVGALVGGQTIGYVNGTAGGLHLDAGLKRDRLFLYGEYDFLSVGQSSLDHDNPIRGFMHRFGVSARYSLAAFGGRGDIPIRGDIWAEVGVGHQAVSWHEGGKLGRKDLSLGLGAQATFKIGRDKPKYIGVYYALKAFVARSPERKDDGPTCAGPCDQATGPSPYDVGVYFNFGVPFGR